MIIMMFPANIYQVEAFIILCLLINRCISIYILIACHNHKATRIYNLVKIYLFVSDKYETSFTFLNKKKITFNKKKRSLVGK